MAQSFLMAIERTKWLKFRLTAAQYQDAKIEFAKSGERWFWRWCQKLFSQAVESRKIVPQKTK
jgi:hypothetical protein